MKKRKKILVMLLMGCVLLTQTNLIVSANEKEITEAVYDITLGGTQEFVIQDENGEEAKVIVEEIAGKARVDAGTYKVQFEAPGWTAGFYVVISNDKITSAYSAYHSANWGKISNAKLTKNSTVKATYSFTFKVVLTFETGVLCQIKNGSMSVTKI